MAGLIIKSFDKKGVDKIRKFVTFIASFLQTSFMIIHRWSYYELDLEIYEGILLGLIYLSIFGLYYSLLEYFFMFLEDFDLRLFL
jgi:hypothetical protein